MKMSKNVFWVVARLPQRLKSTLFEIFRIELPRKQTTLILVFEVIVQPPKTHFLTFSSDTKNMKITHSDMVNFLHTQCTFLHTATA